MKQPPRNPVSPDDREAFKTYLLSWQDRLGLQGWRVHPSSKPATAGAMASVTCDHKARLASVRLGKDFGGEAVTPESLEGTALHELLHVLLYELCNQVEIGLEGEALDSAEHRVIHVLERLLLKGS
jgi:hypothetical protein